MQLHLTPLFTYFTVLVSSALISFSVAASSPLEKTPITKILFGSCSHQSKPMPILDAVNQENADLFIFLGDNIYGDTENMEELARKYQKLGANKRFAQLRKKTPTIAIWDDHDFGENDAGKDYPQKHASKQIMLDFWQEPQNSIRRSQENGIYTAYSYGKASQRVQIILPDLRWNRDELTSVGKINYYTQRKAKNMGPYSPSKNKHASMLGEQQWQWLEQELLKPAKIKIIASSLQLLPEFTGWESWANFPADRQRLLDFIEKHKINGVLFISGDTHWGEISKIEHSYPLWEITSSGLTEEWKDISPNKHRIGKATSKVNYGEINIDWQQPDPLITLNLNDINGKTLQQHHVTLSTLSHSN